MGPLIAMTVVAIAALVVVLLLAYHTDRIYEDRIIELENERNELKRKLLDYQLKEKLAEKIHER